MPKVPLTRIANTSYIKAPSFCPYSDYKFDVLPTFERAEEDVKIVSPTICAVCKMCTFIPGVDTLLGLTQQEKDKCKEYLTSFNSRLSRIINSQISYLLTKERSPLVILLTANVLQNMLEYSIKDKERRNTLFHYFIDTEIRICNAYGCPIYFARRLTRSVIQVVGEAEWK